MKTKVILMKGWEILAEYDFPITMSKGDVVLHYGFEYKVEKCLLDTNINEMLILVVK
jgi:hypothetical protein